MNLSDFVELSEELLADDERLKLSVLMNSLLSASQNYASSPGEPSHQIEFSKSLQELGTALATLEKEFNPGTALRIDEIGASRWFSHLLIEEITSSVSENPMTPAIISETVRNLNELRSDYISKLRASEGNLREFGVGDTLVVEGQAVVKFIVPRVLFDNELKGLDKELKFVI